MLNIIFKEKRAVLFLTAALFLILFQGCATTAPDKAAVNAKDVSGESAPPEKDAKDYYLEGKMAESKEDWGSAISAYLEALEYDPMSDEIASSLTNVLIRDGKIKAATKYSRLSVKLNPKNAQYWRLLQLLEQQEGNYKEASKALEIYMKLNPNYEFIDLLRMADYNFNLDKREAGKKLLMNRAKDITTPAGEMYELGEMLAINGFFDEAISVYKTVVERDPLDVQGWLYLGNLYSKAGMDKESMESYSAALEKNPDDVLLLISVGNQCLLENRWDCCLEYFEKVYGLGQKKVEEAGVNYTEITKTLTAVYFYAGKDKEGLKMLDGLRAVSADDAELYFSLGKTMNYLKRYQEAYDYFKTGFAKNPGQNPEDTFIRAYSGCAKALVELGRGDDAIELIRNDAPNKIKAVHTLKELEAGVYMELKKYDDAVAIYEWLVSSDPSNRGYLLASSIAYDLSGNFEKAEKALQKVLELDPEDHLAMNNLAYMYLDKNINVKKAFRMVQQAIEDDPANGAYLDTLGWAYFRMGKYSEARKHIERALILAGDEDKGVIYEHLGDSLVKLKKVKEALDAYKKAIEFGAEKDTVIPKMDGLSK